MDRSGSYSNSPSFGQISLSNQPMPHDGFLSTATLSFPFPLLLPFVLLSSHICSSLSGPSEYEESINRFLASGPP